MTKMSLAKDYPNLFELKNEFKDEGGGTAFNAGQYYLFLKGTEFTFDIHSKKIQKVKAENGYPIWRLACLEDLLESEEISINLKEQILFHLDLFR